VDRILVFPSCTAFRETSIDLSVYGGSCIEEFVDAAVMTLRSELAEGDSSIVTLHGLALVARKELFPWLVAASSVLGRVFTRQDIDHDLLESFAADLRLANSYTTASNKFNLAMMLVERMSRLGYLAPFNEIRPAVQFPGAAAAAKASLPYSKRERDELLRALAADFRDIRDRTRLDIEPGSVDSLVIGLLLLALPTGFNLTPLLEIGRDALRPHPLRRNEWLLVAFKLRGNKEVVARIKWSDEIAAMRSLDLHLVPVFKHLVQWTEANAVAADKAHRNLVFIRPPVISGRHVSGRTVPLTAGDFGRIIVKLNARYAITGDDGARLRISTRRIRATLAARIYDLSGGDPFVVARVLGNLPRTTALHYLEPEFGAPSKFAKAVAAFAERLRNGEVEEGEATPVGACSNPLHGRFAPKDGITYCQRWLHCFQCPNQCITGDESGLWRLYSFYWLLHERSQALRRMKISGQVRFALHVIDTVVAERFGVAAAKAKARARAQPHPIWASAKAMDLFTKEVMDA